MPHQAFILVALQGWSIKVQEMIKHCSVISVLWARQCAAGDTACCLSAQAGHGCRNCAGKQAE
jgi:hypothetical protein